MMVVVMWVVTATGLPMDDDCLISFVFCFVCFCFIFLLLFCLSLVIGGMIPE